MVGRQQFFFLITVGLHISNALFFEDADDKPEDICVINLETGLSKNAPPLVIDSSSKPPEFLYPWNFHAPTRVFRRDKTISLFCPRKPDETHSHTTEPQNLEVNGVIIPTPEPKQIKCIGWDKFNTVDDLLDQKGQSLEDFSCQFEKHSYDPILRPMGEPLCGSGHRYEIGYDLGDGNFLRTIELCHDPKESKTLWAHHVLQPLKYEKNSDPYKHGKYKKGMLYEGMDFNEKNPYSHDSIRESFLTIFRNHEEPEKNNITKQGEEELSAGQLISRLDKFYVSEIESTFFFANLVPIWKVLREEKGNWYNIQTFIRQLAYKENRTLEVWAGGFGQLKLIGKNIAVDAKLDSNGEVESKIPAPLYLYQCIADKTQKEALCMIVLNNPLVLWNELDNHVVCTKVNCNNPILRHFSHFIYGFGYCCTLKDFYEKNKDQLGLEVVEPYLDYAELSTFSMFEEHHVG